MKLSLLMPVYNEQNIVEKTITDYIKELKLLALTVQFIVINDASTDNTHEILDKLAAKYSNLQVIHKTKNEGQGKALRDGLNEVYGDWIFQADSDYQNDPNDYDKLIREAPMADIIIGYRWRRKDPFFRRLNAFLLRIAVLLMFGLYFKDVNSPFRLVSKKAVLDTLKFIPCDFFLFNIATAIAARKLGYNVLEVPVKHVKRVEGESKLKVLSKALATLRQLFALSANLNM